MSDYSLKAVLFVATLLLSLAAFVAVSILLDLHRAVHGASVCPRPTTPTEAQAA